MALVSVVVVGMVTGKEVVVTVAAVVATAAATGTKIE